MPYLNTIFRSFSCSVFYAHRPLKCVNPPKCAVEIPAAQTLEEDAESPSSENMVECDDVPSAAKVKLTQQGRQDGPPSCVLFISISSGFTHYILGTCPVCLKSGSSLLKAAGALAAFVGWLHLVACAEIISGSISSRFHAISSALSVEMTFRLVCCHVKQIAKKHKLHFPYI